MSDYAPETPEQEARRLESARTWVGLRQREQLRRAIRESHMPPPEPVDSAKHRREQLRRATDLVSERAQAPRRRR